VPTWAGYAVDPLEYLKQYLDSALQFGTVKVGGLRVRATPGTSEGNTVLYGLSKGATVEVLEIKKVDGWPWLRLRSVRPEWVCMQMGTVTYVELGEKEEPVPAGLAERVEKLETWARERGYAG
jgi:hypothetical protein